MYEVVADVCLLRRYPLTLVWGRYDTLHSPNLKRWLCKNSDAQWKPGTDSDKTKKQQEANHLVHTLSVNTNRTSGVVAIFVCLLLIVYCLLIAKSGNEGVHVQQNFITRNMKFVTLEQLAHFLGITRPQSDNRL